MRRAAYWLCLWLADRCDCSAGWLTRAGQWLDAMSERLALHKTMPRSGYGLPGQMPVRDPASRREGRI